MTELRRSSAKRFSGALWGILIAACGGLMIASFQGFQVDVELAGILALCGVGLWLLLTALFASGTASRASRQADTTKGEETADDARAGTAATTTPADPAETTDTEPDTPLG